MSNQEVWITIRIKSELDMETDAIAFAKELTSRITMGGGYTADEYQFLRDAHTSEVIEVEEERHIYSQECLEDDDVPYRLVEEV